MKRGFSGTKSWSNLSKYHSTHKTVADIIFPCSLKTPQQPSVSSKLRPRLFRVSCIPPSQSPKSRTRPRYGSEGSDVVSSLMLRSTYLHNALFFIIRKQCICWWWATASARKIRPLTDWTAFTTIIHLQVLLLVADEGDNPNHSPVNICQMTRVTIGQHSEAHLNNTMPSRVQSPEIHVSLRNPMSAQHLT